MNYFYSNTFFVFIFFISLTSDTIAQTSCSIILINGTSGAGKTVTSQILKSLLNGQTKITGCEQIISETVIEKACSQGYVISPEEMQLATLEKWITSHWSQTQINEVMLEARSRFDEQMKKAIQKNKYLIIDEAALTQDEINLYEQYAPTFKVLLYCPINILSYHILEHNNKKGVISKSFDTSLSQFLSLYYPESLMYHTIAGILTPQDMQRTFITRDIRIFPSMSTIEIDTEMNKLEASFKQHFKCSKDEAYLTPTIPHDLILNSGVASPEECARLIKIIFEKTITAQEEK